MLEETILDYEIRQALSSVLSVAACLAAKTEDLNDEYTAMAENIERGTLEIIKKLYEDASYNEWESLLKESRSEIGISEGEAA